MRGGSAENAVRVNGSKSSPSEVAPGVYRLGTKWVNSYLVEDEGEFILIDAGYPGYWKQIVAATEALGASPEAIRAVLATHHHVDHTGTAERLRQGGARVFVGAEDADKVSGRRPSHPPQGFYRQAWRPNMIGYLAHTVAAGGARYRAVEEHEALGEDQTLELPSYPHVVKTPGHTAGHYSVALVERGVLFTGDALVNFDYASGRRGITLHRFNEDRRRALESLAYLVDRDASVVLFGHGDPWTDGVRSAVERARETS
jgi:glyoxylase-like metal-dependent hydrolase (beta-lactamase superfamily II)